MAASSFRVRFFFLLLLPFTFSSPLSPRVPQSEPVVSTGTCFSVPETGTFTEHALYDFSTASDIPSGLKANGWPLPDPRAPCDQQLSESNVYVRDRALNLLVPGGQGPCTTGGSRKSISVAEVQTVDEKILYASVRTMAKFSAIEGTCASEIDIEYLSSPNSNSNQPRGVLHLFYMNQPSTSTNEPMPANDQASTFHEYRIDWTPGSTKFYFDGKVRQTFTTDVPQIAGPWIWNHWRQYTRSYRIRQQIDYLNFIMHLPSAIEAKSNEQPRLRFE
ncbi:MAG: hypothetical protein Q9160_004796 [Pyrenula sp. 1 TL-2023]